MINNDSEKIGFGVKAIATSSMALLSSISASGICLLSDEMPLDAAVMCGIEAGVFTGAYVGLIALTGRGLSSRTLSSVFTGASMIGACAIALDPVEAAMLAIPIGVTGAMLTRLGIEAFDLWKNKIN